MTPLDIQDRSLFNTVVLYCWCHSDSASVLLYFTYLSFKRIHVYRLVEHLTISTSSVTKLFSLYFVQISYQPEIYAIYMFYMLSSSLCVSIFSLNTANSWRSFPSKPSLATRTIAFFKFITKIVNNNYAKVNTIMKYKKTKLSG